MPKPCHLVIVLIPMSSRKPCCCPEPAESVAYHRYEVSSELAGSYVSSRRIFLILINGDWVYGHAVVFHLRLAGQCWLCLSASAQTLLHGQLSQVMIGRFVLSRFAGLTNGRVAPYLCRKQKLSFSMARCRLEADVGPILCRAQFCRTNDTVSYGKGVTCPLVRVVKGLVSVLWKR